MKRRILPQKRTKPDDSVALSAGLPKPHRLPPWVRRFDYRTLSMHYIGGCIVVDLDWFRLSWHQRLRAFRSIRVDRPCHRVGIGSLP